jgi:hypothetical protein
MFNIRGESFPLKKKRQTAQATLAQLVTSELPSVNTEPSQPQLLKEPKTNDLINGQITRIGRFNFK